MTVSAQLVGDALRAQAKALPEKLFVWCADQTYTFREMDEVSDRVAAGLSELGITKGDRIAFVSMNRPEMLEMMFGCAKIGAIQVPLNAYLRGEFLRYQIGDCQAQTLVVDEPGYDAAMGLLDQLPELKRIIVFDAVHDAPGVEVLSYGRVRSSGAPVPQVDIAPADLMSILYTSGTTGLPKGCMLPHGYYIHIAAAMKDVWGIRPDDVVFTALPLFHGAARVMVTTAALVHGATAVIEPMFSVTSVWDRIIETGATIFGGAGMMGVAMLSMPPSDKDRAHKLRHAGFVPLPEEMQLQFEERFGCTCYAELFGQTECVPVCYTPPDAAHNRASAGKPAPFFDVRLVDDDDAEVPVGEVGEIVVRPKEPFAMYQGYWNKPEDTMKAWRNLWHHTGDYGRRDADGFISFVDRKKDALRRRGENVSSMELENAIVRHPKILECAILAVPSEMTEDDIKACLVLAPGQAVEPAELFEFFKAELPYFAIPRYYEILPELPRNAVQRVMKHLLRPDLLSENTIDLEALEFTVARADRR